MHPFDTAIALTTVDAHCSRGATTSAYANMVGPFGGTTAAVLLNAALRHAERRGEPVALTVNYASALADGAFEIDARAVRTNRSTQHWILQLRQGDDVAATATAVFATRRETWSAPEATAPADPPAPDTLARQDPTRRPPWVQRYDMRFIDGGMPTRFDGAEHPHSHSCLWVRDDPPRPIDFASLAALCDTFFPRVYLRRRKIVPIGTVSLTTYFHADTAMLAAHGAQPVLASAHGLNFRNGYCDQRGELWSARRELLASTQQVMYYRE